MSDTIKLGLKLISMMGYPGLFLGLLIEFVGIAFPGEIVLTFTGFLIWNGHLGLFPAILSTVAGSLCGSIIAYALGRHYGRPFLERYGRYVFIRPKSINRAERWFKRHSMIVLLLGRFVPGVRPLSAYMAGIARMRFWVFAPISLLGVFIWCLAFVLLGNKLGQNWNQVINLLEKYHLFLILAIGGAAVLYVIKLASGKLRS